jgi:hypothetical protein
VATVGCRDVDHVEYLPPQRDREVVQIVVGECDSAEQPGERDQIAVLVGQVRRSVGCRKRRHRRRGLVVLAAGGVQAGLQEVGTARIAPHHVPRVGTALRQGGIGRDAVPDAADTFAHTVVGGAHQVDLAELRASLQRQVVAVGFFDCRQQCQQQILGSRFVGGPGEPPGPVQITGDRHRVIIGRPKAADAFPRPPPRGPVSCNRP